MPKKRHQSRYENEYNLFDITIFYIFFDINREEIEFVVVVVVGSPDW